MADFPLQENVSLSKYTTFKVGGLARYFIECKSIEQVKNVTSWAKEKALSIFVLADGSNVIVSEKGFDGLVMRIKIEFVKIKDNILEAGPATSMEELVNQTVDKELSGIEWAGGLPGSFAGAIRGNAGAFGGEIKDTISEVKSISLVTGKEIIRNNTQCKFGYRHSIYKELANEVIVSAKLKLNKGDRDELRKIADSRIEYRRQRHPLDLPNSGSIFKNTPVDNIPSDQLDQWKDNIKTDPFPVVPTAKIIADAGLQGMKIGGAQVSTKHSNYIVNLGGATGEDIYELIKKIKAVVYEKYGVELEVEPELLGF